MKRILRREREAPANGCCNEATGMVIASNPARGTGGRAARCATALEELDDDHASAAARACRAMIGHRVWLGGAVRCRRLCRRLRGGDQLPGSRGVGFAAGTCEQAVVADAVKSFGQNVKQEASDELVGGKGHRAIPHLPVAAVILVAEGDAALVESKQAAV